MFGQFDIKTFVQNLRATKPPYECPFPKCGKIYKSHSGIQFHLYNYDHQNPENTPVKKPGGSSKKNKSKKGLQRSPSPADYVCRNRDQLSYAEAQKIVEIEVDGKVHRLNIYDKLEIIPQDEIDNCDNIEKEEQPEKTQKGTKGKEGNKKKEDPQNNQPAKLPEAVVKELPISQRKCTRMPTRPISYYRFIDKTPEELNEEVEYDMDEEVSSFMHSFLFV